jgi:hypothetical protein
MLAEEHPECLRYQPVRSTRPANQRSLAFDVRKQYEDPPHSPPRTHRHGNLADL